MIIETPYGKAKVYRTNRKTIRVQTIVGNVCFLMEKKMAKILNKGLNFPS